MQSSQDFFNGQVKVFASVRRTSHHRLGNGYMIPYFFECCNCASAFFECFADKLLAASLESFREDLGFHLSGNAANTAEQDIPGCIRTLLKRTGFTVNMPNPWLKLRSNGSFSCTWPRNFQHPPRWRNTLRLHRVCLYFLPSFPLWEAFSSATTTSSSVEPSLKSDPLFNH